MMQHLQAPIPSMRKGAPDAPSWFDGILQRALAKSRAERFATATEFQSAIETLAASEAGLQIRPTRLAIPKATQPEDPPGPTRLASTIRVSVPETRLASEGAWPAAATPPVLPPPPLPRPVPGPAPVTRAITWRQMTAAGAVLVVLAAVGVLGLRRLLRPTPTVAAADAGGGTPQPAPKPPIHDAPDPGGVVAPPVLPGPSTEPGMPPTGGRKIALPGSGGSPGRSSPGGAAPAPAPAPGPAPAPTPGPDPVETPPSPPKPEEAAPAPIAAEANAVEIDEVALIVGEGREREEKEVIVRFESQRIVLRDPDADDAVIRSVPFRGLEATYARARYPVGTADRDRPAYVRGVSKGGGGLFRRTPHWLTLEGAGAPLVFKLDGGQAEKIVGLLEGRANVKVERVSER